MPERYTRLYSAQPNLYALDSPVVIEAGALLKDNKTGGILGQLKFLNITNKKIISLTIALDTYDISDNFLEEIEYTYMDLDVSRDESFGTKTPIVFENSNIRKFEPFVRKVIFFDKTFIELNKCKWEQIPEQTSIYDELDEEYVSAYQYAYSDSAEYFAAQFKDIWICSCGKINKINENACHYCNVSQSDNLIDENSLQNKLTCIIAENLINIGSREAFVEALEYLNSISEFEDTKKLIDKCTASIETIDKENYEKQVAEEKALEQDLIRRQKIASITKKIVSIASIIICLFFVFVIVWNSVIIPYGKYNEAKALKDAGKFAEAISAFEKLNGYKDSEAQILECNNAILNVKYIDAIALINECKYIEAISLLESLNGYKDATNKIEECNISIYGKEVWNKIKSVNIGETYKLGTYEQDNDKSNGSEDIEWLVLAKNKEKILLVSKFVLDCKQYNRSHNHVTWETSTLCMWLNNEFINSAFSTEEIKMISPIMLYRVFLLNMTEANQYFSSDTERQCKPTDYAVAKGVKVDPDNGNCRWWLREPGKSTFGPNATTVAAGGTVTEIGYFVDYDNIGVRPALWIDLSKIN